jgi:hypothetical protein
MVDVYPFPLGDTNIGKSAMLKFLTKGERPVLSHTTAFYIPFSEEIVFYRKDWNRISKKMFGEIIPKFADFMMRDARPANKPALKKTVLASCNKGVADGDDNAKISDLNEDYDIIRFSGPDTGGQKRYRDVLYDVANFCSGYTIYPCFRYESDEKWSAQFNELKDKMKIVEEQLGSNYEWNGAYIQLQRDMDKRMLPEGHLKELKAIKDLPIYHISSMIDNRYDIIDIFVIQAIIPVVAQL